MNDPLNILVVGSGGREHALEWKLSQSPRIDKVFTAPGNGGTTHNVPIYDIEGLADFAASNDCFTVVGPEAFLAEGIVDKFQERGLLIFGPTKMAAQLESSKIWAKNFMKKNNIPTARFEIFDNPDRAIQYVNNVKYDVVVKADGLASGKGVIVCSNKQQAKKAIQTIMVDKKFGAAGNKIIIEERIYGTEASCISICDGTVAVQLTSSQDHKRIYDDDKGPNTGGMGAYSPAPIVDDIYDKIQDILQKTVSCMKKEGAPFVGFLYAGIIIKNNTPYVLEFNVRMGDPECQPIMVRADFDFYEYLIACTQKSLNTLPAPKWKRQHAVCVVLASKDYPNKYPTGEKITGLSDLDMIFHAGTTKSENAILTNGGRVLGVTALGDSLQSAIHQAYHTVHKITWPSKYFRSDIGKKGL